jgi:tetratricopeptide (TPR) repeat protein
MAMTVAALVAFAATSFAQMRTLEGNVIDKDGKPVQGAVIKIHRTDIKWDASLKTDKKGHYVHSGVQAGGTYEVSCEIDGKLVDKVGGVRASGGEQPPINFDMRKKAASADNNQALMQKALETGQISDELKRQMSPEQQAALAKQLGEASSKMKQQKALNDAFNDGVTALQAKQWDAAVAALEKASAIHVPDEVDANQAAVLANLGDAYSGQASTKTGADFDAGMDKALKAYSQALTLNPADAAAHNNYALALAKAKRYPEMEAELKKAASLDPATAYSKFYNLGALLTNNGQGEAAGKAFKLAIDAAPDNPKNAESYYQYGMSLAGQTTEKDGKYISPPGTIEALQKYLELAPAGPNAELCKAMIAQLGGTVQTSFQNPNAPANKKKK